MTSVIDAADGHVSYACINRAARGILNERRLQLQLDWLHTVV